MRVFNVVIPNQTPLTNFKIWEYAWKIKLSYLLAVCMLDELPKKVKKLECGIVNLNEQGEKGSHWVAYWKNGKKIIYLDSYGKGK